MDPSKADLAIAELALAGEDCESCASFWDDQDLPLRRMVALNKHTDNKFIPVVVCPRCDGEPIIELSRATRNV